MDDGHIEMKIPSSPIPVTITAPEPEDMKDIKEEILPLANGNLKNIAHLPV